MSDIQIIEAIEIAALAVAIILMLVCMLEFRYMDEPGDTPRPLFPPAVHLTARDLRELDATHTDLTQKPHKKGQTGE